MRVLVACEFSGTVRDAFIAKGHEAMSCDLLPTEKPGPHYQGDLFDVIDYPWDLAIFHPECTHLAVSGARHFAEKRMDGRQQRGVAFVMQIVRRSEHIPRIAIENPVSILSSIWRKPEQVIQPYQFGHAETKATCLWLRGLPLLAPTNVVEPDYMRNAAGEYYRDKKGKRYSRIHFMSGRQEHRWKLRSKTYQGIADAMAEQWGST